MREELPQLKSGQVWLLPQESAAAVAAWLLPAAERVAPDLGGELFWRSLALRPPRPRRDRAEHPLREVELTDIELAKLLSRYDRDVARALLEPLAANAYAAGSVPVQTRGGGTASIFRAAMLVDPRWAKNLLDAVADSPSSMELADRLRFAFVWTLALPLPDRWVKENDYTASLFWAPTVRDRPLPP